MIAHDGYQDLIGEVEEGGIKVALNDGGKLVEVGYQPPQRGVFVNLVVAALGVGSDFLFDFFLALRGADDDAV